MADSILRLRVDSAEYDNKLKQATNGLTRYVDECRKVGGTLEVVEKETLDYVRALGQMETTSRTATGKLAEMKKTFVELSAQYKSMTDEEKNSPFGKALASSLDQLKGRITESKKGLDDINQSINGGGGLTSALDSLTSKFGMSIQSLAGWGTALAAGKVALDVAKDAFFASEATVDEWGRVMDSSKSLYEGFLTALNTGDISGYLSRIDSIVQAARIAYNELDRLGTMKTIQAPQMSAQQTENERMRMMIQTGRYIAPVDGRKASMQNGQLLTPEQIKRIEQQLQGGMQKVVTLIGNEVAQTGRAIDAVYNRQAQELGMSLKEFRKGTSSMAEFDKRMAGYENYQKWRTEHTTIDMQSGREIVARGNPFEQYAKWGTFRVDGERYNNLVGLIQQRDQQAGQAYGMQSQVYRTMNRAEGVTLRQIMGGGGGGGSTGSRGGSQQTELQQNQARINTLTQEYVRLGDESTEAARQRQEEIQKEIALLEKRNGQLKLYQEQAKGKLLGPDTFRQQLSVDVAVNNKKIEELEKQLLSLDGITIDPKTVKVTAETDEARQKVEELKRQIAELKDQNLMINAGMASLDLQNAQDLSRTGGLTGFVGVGKDMMPIEGLPSMSEVVRQRGGNLLDDKAMKAVNDGIYGDTGKKGEKNSAKSLLNGISQLTDGLQKIGIDIPEEVQAVIGVIQGMMQVIEAVNTIIGVTQTTALTANTAAIISLEAAIWANTASSIIPFANGGVVRAAGGTVVGNTYSGDQIPALLNAGEVVLNRSQVSTLASSLQGGGLNGLSLYTEISMEKLRIGLNNNSRRKGKGEYVTSNKY